ncbi:MAG TPA: FtsX-like permease family protein [Candidatus Acidoferrales bacterium]|nr:FtsX-like permease family protein [Candidatus Acidoferrales bacterium]
MAPLRSARLGGGDEYRRFRRLLQVGSLGVRRHDGQLALLLTAIGVYGLLAFAVASRTSEIGTRMALGASCANVLALVLKQGAGLIAAGLLLGLAGALAVTRSLSTLLFGVQATDPYTFAAVAVLLLAVGLAASYFPARRAMKVDPMTALRYE